MVISVVASLVASILVGIEVGTASLHAATWGLFAFVVLWTIGALVWGYVNPSEGKARDLARPLQGGVGTLVTVAGVVLGFVFTFVDKTTGHVQVGIKVGLVSLTISLLLGVTLYSLLGGRITDRKAVNLSTGWFSVIAWLLGYGLLCIVSATVAS